MKIFYKTINNIFKNKFLLSFLILILIFILIYFLGFRFNLTPSMPIGIYHISESLRLNHGDYVQYCLEDEKFIRLASERKYLKQGSCQNGLQPLFKEVLALENDEVKITEKGILINNILAENSVYKSFDKLNRKMPQANFENKNFKVPNGKALILSSQHKGSFDSRYFGLVKISSLRTVAPILVWSKKNNAFKEN